MLWGYLDVTNDTPSDKAILKCHELRILVRIDDLDIHQLNVEILIHTVQGASKDDIILEFDSNLFSDQRFEKGKKDL